MAKEDKNKKGAESAPVTDITVDNIREQLGKLKSRRKRTRTLRGK